MKSPASGTVPLTIKMGRFTTIDTIKIISYKHAHRFVSQVLLESA